MKLLVKDGLGKRIVTEIKRPDPEAVLILEEDKEIDVTVEELFILVDLEYVKLKHVKVDGQDVSSIYPDAIKLVGVLVKEQAKPEPKSSNPAPVKK